MPDPIGQIPVIISGDYSALQKDLQRAEAIAREAGSKIGAALSAGSAAYAGMATGANSYSEAAQSVINIQKQLDGELTAARGALVEVQLAYEAGAVSANTLARAEMAAAEASKAADVALQRVAESNRLAAAEAHAHTQRLNEMFSGMQQAGMALTALVTVPIVGVGVAAIKMSEELNQASISFNTMLGSAEKAAAFMQEIKTFALSTPFQFPELVDASKRMMALGFAAKDVVPTLRIVGDTVAAMGGGKEKLDGIILALGQMQAKAKVSAQEMNQLSERGVKAWEILADAIGVSIPKAMKLAESGAISASQAIPALLDGMNAKFKGQMEVMAQSLTGIWSNFQDQVTFVLADIGKSLTPLFKDILNNVATPLLNVIKDLSASFAALDPNLQKVIIGVAALAAAAGPILVTVGFLGQGVMALSAAATAMGLSWAGVASAATAAAGPLALLAVAIAGIHFSGLDEEAISFAATLKNSLPGLADLFKPLVDSTNELLDVLAKAFLPIEALRTSFLALLSSVNPKAILDFINPFEALKDVLKEASKWLEFLSGNYKSMADAGVANLQRLSAGNKDYETSIAGLTARHTENLAILEKIPAAHIKIDNSAKIAAATEKAWHKQNLEDIKAEDKAREDAAKAGEKLNDQFIKAGEKLNEALHKTDTTMQTAWAHYIEGANKSAQKQTEITRSIDETIQAGVRMPGVIGTISDGFEEMRKKVVANYESVQRLRELAGFFNVDLSTGLSKAVTLFDEFAQRSDSTLPAIQGAWTKIAGEIDKLARVNLPEAVKQYKIMADAMAAKGAPLGQQLKFQEDILTAIIREKELRGEAANADIIALDNIRRQQEKLSESTRRWGDLYVDIRHTIDGFMASIGPTLVGALWGNEQNDALDKQAKDLQASLAESATDFATFGETIAAQMEGARHKNAETLAGELADLHSNLDDKQAAYDEFRSGVYDDLYKLRSDSAEELAKELGDLQNALADKQSSYDKYYDDVQEKIQRLVDDDAASLADQLDNLRDSLRDKTQSYDDYVQDVNTKLGRINEDTQGDIQDQNVKVERNIADKNLSYDRDERDTLDRIERLKKAGKKESDSEIVDLRTALARKKYDRDEYNRRQRQDLATYTAEHKKAAQRQTTDLQTNLAQRTRDQQEYIAENAKNVTEVTEDHKKALDRQVGDLKDSLLERQHDLLAYMAENAAQAEQIRSDSAKKLAEGEKDLLDSLTRKTAEYEKYKSDVAIKADELRASAAASLAKEEADLAASLANKTAEYEKYKLGVEAKLQELKDQHQTVWDEIADMIIGKNGVLNKIANSVVGTILKPFTDFVGDLAASAIKAIGESIFGQAIGGLFDKLFEKVLGSALDIGASAANTSAVVANTAAIVALTASITGEAVAGVSGSAAGAAGSAAGGAASAAGAAASGLAGIVTAVSGVATAISSIIGNFQMYAMNKSLDLIEHNTRYSMMYLGEREDGGILGVLFKLHEAVTFGPLVEALGALYERLGEMWATLQDVKDFMGANLTAPLQVMGVPGLSPSTTGPSMDSAGVLSGGSDRASVYVNALDPSARATTKALVRGLEEVGIKVR